MARLTDTPVPHDRAARTTHPTTTTATATATTATTTATTATATATAITAVGTTDTGTACPGTTDTRTTGTGGGQPGQDRARTVRPDAEVARARRGDQAAWTALVARYDRLLRHIARGYRLPSHDVEDVVQQTWLSCVQHLDQLSTDASFAGWLSTICRRECTRHLSRSRRCEPVDPTALVLSAHCLGGRSGSGEDDVARELIRRDELANLRRAIADLPPRQREVLDALTADGFDDYAATAARTGIPVGSLGPTRARAVARLQADPRLALAG